MKEIKQVKKTQRRIRHTEDKTTGGTWTFGGCQRNLFALFLSLLVHKLLSLFPPCWP